jgi:hypothetical protein
MPLFIKFCVLVVFVNAMVLQTCGPYPPFKNKPNPNGNVVTFPLKHPRNSNIIPYANSFLYLKISNLNSFQFA